MTAPFNFDAAILVTEENLDKIAELNGGLRPEVESPLTFYIAYADPEKPNDIISSDEFFANYWPHRIPKNEWFRADKF